LYLFGQGKDHATKKHKTHKKIRASAQNCAFARLCFLAQIMLYSRPVMTMKDDANLNDSVAEEDAIEYSNNWTEEDLQDLSTFALSHSENPHETDKNTPKP